MSSNTFHFQQFTINQDKTAMKIGTDGVLLGALCDVQEAKKVLDIGTGTGLVSLMCAQKSEAEITALEIDEDAYNQAVDNFKNSKFSSRIKPQKIDFCEFYKIETEQFDYIISNPPFFVNSQKSDDYKRNLARHSDSLPFEKLIKGASKLLSKNGKFSVIIPFSEDLEFVRLCALNKLHLTNKTTIKARENSQPIRVILTFEKSINPLIYKTLLIYNNEGKYSEEFTNLTKDFYIK